MPDRFEDFALRLRDNDNVAVAKRPLAANLSLNGSISLTTDREIPAGHKIAIAAIAQGRPILKYGPGRGAIQLGQPHEVLKRVLAGIAKHPTIFGYVMIGLGCETNQVSFIRSDYRLDLIKADEQRPLFINIQHAGGVSKTVDAAAAAV